MSNATKIETRQLGWENNGHIVLHKWDILEGKYTTIAVSHCGKETKLSFLEAADQCDKRCQHCFKPDE